MVEMAWDRRASALLLLYVPAAHSLLYSLLLPAAGDSSFPPAKLL